MSEPKKKKRRLGGTGAVALAFGAAFTTLLDPAKKAASEELDRTRERGNHERGLGGERFEL